MMRNTNTLGQQHPLLKLTLLHLPNILKKLLQRNLPLIKLDLKLISAILPGLNTTQQVENLLWSLVVGLDQIHQVLLDGVVLVGREEVVHLDVLAAEEGLLGLDGVADDV